MHVYRRNKVPVVFSAYFDENKQYMIMILDRNKTFIPTLCILGLEKEPLNIKGVNYGMIYQIILKV